MKKTLVGIAAVAALVLAVTAVRALAGDEVTITGKGMCAKCELKQGDVCQTVIQAEKDGKKVMYYLVDNDVAKEFHKNVCKETKKVTATGTVKEVNGKMELTVTKIELAK